MSPPARLQTIEPDANDVGDGMGVGERAEGEGHRAIVEGRRGGRVARGRVGPRQLRSSALAGCMMLEREARGSRPLPGPGRRVRRTRAESAPAGSRRRTRSGRSGAAVIAPDAGWEAGVEHVMREPAETLSDLPERRGYAERPRETPGPPRSSTCSRRPPCQGAVRAGPSSVSGVSSPWSNSRSCPRGPRRAKPASAAQRRRPWPRESRASRPREERP